MVNVYISRPDIWEMHKHNHHNVVDKIPFFVNINTYDQMEGRRNIKMCWQSLS